MDGRDHTDAARARDIYEARRKSLGAAYLLLIFFGGFGAHRFYLDTPGPALAQVMLNIVGWVTITIGVGLFVLIALGIWLFFDLFLLPDMVWVWNARLADRLNRGDLRA